MIGVMHNSRDFYNEEKEDGIKLTIGNTLRRNGHTCIEYHVRQLSQSLLRILAAKLEFICVQLSSTAPLNYFTTESWS